MTDKTTRPPKDNLVRAVFPGPEYRSDATTDGTIGTLEGHFAVWNQWTEINSTWEGNFMERVAPSAFDKAVSENTPKVLFQHGQDPVIGDKPLGPIRELRPDDEGMYYNVGLMDTSYNRDLKPGLEAGLYGSSFRFSVVKESFNRSAKKSDYNPKGLPERTILEATLPEFGPVTFPAYANATASARMEMRSMTDDFILSEALDQFIEQPDKLRALLDQRGGRLPEPPERANALPTDGAASEHSDEGSRSEPVSNSVKADGVAFTVAQPDPPPAVAAPTPPDPAPKAGSSSNREIPKMNLEELRSRQDEITARFQEIHTEHGVNKLPDEVKAEWDALKEERADIEARVTEFEERTALLRDLSDKPQNVERVEHRTTRTSTATRVPQNIYAVEEYRNLSNDDAQMKQAFRDGAMKAVDTAVFAHPAADEDKNKTELERLLDGDESGSFARHILATGNPIYKRAFTKVVVGKPLTQEEQRAIATVGTTTTGGYNVPFTLDPTLILTSDGSVNPLRQMARVERLTQGNTWKGVTTAGVTITRGPAELQPVTPTEVTFGQPEVTVQPVKVEIQYSIEADEDWPRLQTELARILNEAKDDEEAESFVNGVGTTVYPEGVAYGLDASSDVGTTGDGLDVEDLFRLEGALPARYQARAQFLAHRAIYASIRQFSTGATSGEGSVWQRGLQAGDPAQLLGYPARSISTMEADATADGERIMLFGDFAAGFLIVDKVGMTIEIDPHVRNGDGKWIGARAMLAHYRNSSKVINDNALRALVVGVVTS
jgi:HK97 family phage major capsid protein/HK97 family phage prohead protease